ncbi:hypothetical protein [Sphingorhabdus sp. EL138]|uniref:hypothetical protein n=1 Tax=Sphingorhabdus sp. EL138 TaxID=2073156 RepID=UPI000D687EA9|nr:hypothetical protein [Sphingorhabdus sp. EL138]
MSYEIKKAKDQIGQDMPHTEYSIDQALVSVSDLMSTLVRARLNTGVPASTGQAAILRLAKAQMALVDASSDVLRVHGELKKIGKEYAGHGGHECPPTAKKSEKDQPNLSVVA